MISKFSVKKPFTVIMALLMVIVLGYISFTNMSTDLLPNMDLPYVAIITAYPGAGPEKVEQSLTKPLEQSLSTLNGVENIKSISAENLCAVILEFSENTNLDSSIIEMSSKVNQITAALGSDVGTPMYMKINPDLLPVTIASVDFEGLDRKEVSRRVEEDIIPALERVEGVASVTATGLIENTMKISIDDEKIEELNEKIINAVDETLLEKEDELDDAQRKLDDGKAELNVMKAEQNASLAEATVALQGGMTQLLISKNTVDTTITLLDSADEIFVSIDSYLEQADEKTVDINDYRPQMKVLLTTLKTALVSAQTTVESAYASLDENCEYYEEITAKLDKISERLNRRIEACDKALNLLEDSITLNESVVLLRDNLHSLRKQCRTLRRSMNDTSDELQNQYDLLTEQMEVLEEGKFQYSHSIVMAEIQLNEAQAKLDEGRAAFEKAKEQAYEAAGLDGAITMDTVSALISAENFSMPVGSITDNGVTYSVKVGDLFEDNNELEDWELFNIEAGDIGVIKLEDIANIEYLDNTDDLYAKVNGNDGMLVAIDKQSTYSTTDVAHNVQDAIEKLEDEYAGLTITALSDQGEYIDIVVGSVLDSLIMGGILAILILVLFLKDFRPTLIVAISIPASLLFAIVLMYFTGVSLNIISLAGLALGVGMLVDNSIVVLENIYRLKMLGMPIKEASIQGAKQVGGAIIASTLTTVSVFIPIIFTTGITKQLFTDMGLTIAYSLLASLIVALTVVPALSSFMLKKQTNKKHKLFDGFTNLYVKLLGHSLRHKAIVIILVVSLLALSAYGVTQMGTEFIPESDMKQMSVTVEMPQGSTAEEARAMSEVIIEMLGEIDDIDTIAAMQGGSGMMSMMGGSSNAISMYLLLKDDRVHSSQEVSVMIEEMTADLDCTVSVMSANMSMSMLTGEGVEIVIKGSDLDDLQKAATDIGNMLRETEGITEVETGLEEVAKEIRITVNKNEAMAKGYTVAQIYMEVAEAISTETTATTLEVGNDEYTVVVASGEDGNISIEDIKNLELEVISMQGDEVMQGSYETGADDTASSDGDAEDNDANKEDKDNKDDEADNDEENGEADEESDSDNTVLLKDIAEVTFEDTPKSITHENQVRAMTVTAQISADHNVGKVSDEFEVKLKDYDFPGDCYYETAGENEYIEDALRDLVYMLLIAVAFIYMIMVAQFQSLKSPFIVMFTMPLAFTGGLMLLWLTGFNLSVVAMLGFLVLAGVVVNNGIVFVDYANQLIAEGMNMHDALLETGRARLRPILMTAITTILGLLTIALGIGEGTDMIQPMGVVVIGGLIYSTLLTLFIIPVLYAVFNKPKKSKKKNETHKEENVSE